MPGLNQFFYFRYPSVTVGGVCDSLHKLLHDLDRASDCRTITVVSHRTSLGKSHAQCNNTRSPFEPRTVHDQRTCKDVSMPLYYTLLIHSFVGTHYYHGMHSPLRPENMFTDFYPRDQWLQALPMQLILSLCNASTTSKSTISAMSG